MQGACAEVAVAKALNKYPQLGVRQYSGMAADVSSNLEVRFSTKGELVVRDKDPADRIYVLVTGDTPNLVGEGWLTKGEAKVRGHYKDPGGNGKFAYFVKKDALNDIGQIV